MKKEYYIIYLLIFLGIPLSLPAQTVRAGLESKTAYIGQAVRYTIQISGTEKVNRPPLTGFEEFQIEKTGESTSIQTELFGSKNSKVVVSEYTWLLTPLKKGEIPVPSVTVTVDGQSFRTQEGVLSVIEPGPIEGYHLFLSAEESKLFPGLPVRVTLKWLFSSQVSQPEFTIPFLNQSNLKISHLPPPPQGTSDIYQFAINGETVYATQSAEIYQGKQYTTLSMGWDVYPTQPGSLELAPVILSFKKGVGRDRWGNVQYENAVIPSNSLSLPVDAIPEQLVKYPGGILIAKDTLNLELKISPQRAYPGDPVRVEIQMKNLMKPEMTTFKGLDSYPELQTRFKIDHDSLISFEEDGVLNLKQTVRAIDFHLAEFPALSFLYYNQNSGKVETFKTPAVDLDIIPITSTDQPDRIESSLVPVGGEGKQNESVGLYSNEVLTDIKYQIYKRIPVWVYLCISPVLFLLVYAILLFRSGDPRQFVLSLFKKDDPTLLMKQQIQMVQRDQSLDSFRAFNRFIRSWFTDQFHLKPNFTSIHLEEALFENMDQKKAQEILNFMEQLDRLCWSNLPPGRDDLFSEFHPEVLYSISRRKS